jgi:putative ABC transport system permease protein
VAIAVWRTGRVIGKPLRTDRETFTIVGVMAGGFGFPDRSGVWIPMEAWYSNLAEGDSRRQKLRDSRWYATVARLTPTVTVAQGQGDLDSIAFALARDYPKENDGIGVAITPLREAEMGAVRPYLPVCLIGVAFVLLISCANVANLLLARAAARRREHAVKTALGASSWRIARTLLFESLFVGLAGAALGVAFAWIGVHGLLSMIPVSLPTWLRIEIDVPSFFSVSCSA